MQSAGDAVLSAARHWTGTLSGRRFTLVGGRRARQLLRTRAGAADSSRRHACTASAGRVGLSLVWGAGSPRRPARGELKVGRLVLICRRRNTDFVQVLLALHLLGIPVL